MSNAHALLEAKYRMEVKLCYPLAEALADTLRVQCALESTLKVPYFKDPKAEIDYEIALVSIFSSKLKDAIPNSKFNAASLLRCCLNISRRWATTNGKLMRI